MGHGIVTCSTSSGWRNVPTRSTTFSANTVRHSKFAGIKYVVGSSCFERDKRHGTRYEQKKGGNPDFFVLNVKRFFKTRSTKIFIKIETTYSFLLSTNNMDSHIIPSTNNQDYAGTGRIHDTDYIFAFDGHGTNHVIDQIRAMNMDDIALSSNPVLAVHEQLKGDSYRSGSTMAFARKTGTCIETFNCGDSMIWIYVNGSLRHESIPHTFTNPKEIERTRHLVRRIKQFMAPFPVSHDTVEEILSPSGLFHTGEELVPSQSLGHNNMTELAPEHFTVTVHPTDHVRMVVGSDGFSDMLVDPSQGTARTLAQKAVERWKQKWNYMYQGRIVQTNYDDIDDVSVAVYDDEIKFRPAMCIPWSPLHFTTQDVESTCNAVMGGVLRVDEVVKETHKVFFIHFLPSKMDDGNRYVYGKTKMKLYYSNDWYWNMGISHYTSPLRCVDDVYERWNGLEAYDTFRENQIPSHVCYKMSHYLTEFK